MSQIGPEETDLIGQPVGKWVSINGRVVRDPVTERIDNLASSYLQKIATDTSGWGTLYRDPVDGRYWELTYPHGEYHGGGPPPLTNLSTEQARKKYDDVVDHGPAGETA